MRRAVRQRDGWGVRGCKEDVAALHPDTRAHTRTRASRAHVCTLTLSCVFPNLCFSNTHVQDTHCGWVFAKPTDPPLTATNGKGAFPCTGCVPDTVNGVRFVRDLYEMAGAKKGERDFRDGGMED